MYIKNLTLQNYRNYKKANFEFSSGINILTGNNAQGKTNCAEAIFYLCTGYSPRASRDKQVIKYGEDGAFISGVATSSYGNVKIDIAFSKSKNKEISVNGVPIKKIGELMGNLNSVFFNPEELKLIKESPEDRRRFIDISLSQMSKKYFYALQKYRRIIEQRNDLLKNPDKEVVYETLPLWDEQLSEYAEIIIKERLEFIKLLKPLANKSHEFITNGKEILEISLESNYLEDEENIKESLLKALSERMEKDIILGYTTAGPHRDDIKIKVNGEDVRVYGSQGQQRTSAISLKLAELEIFKQRFNEYPVLILDDALSELDADRRKRLIDRVNGIQTIITCTELTEELLSLKDAKHFVIDNGVIKSAE